MTSRLKARTRLKAKIQYGFDRRGEHGALGPSELQELDYLGAAVRPAGPKLQRSNAPRKIPPETERRRNPLEERTARR